MAKRKFNITFEIDCYLVLDDEVIDRVDDEWRKNLYPLNTPEQIAEHIAYNLILNRWKLSDLDGWADMPASAAKIVDQGDYGWRTTEVTE